MSNYLLGQVGKSKSQFLLNLLLVVLAPSVLVTAHAGVNRIPLNLITQLHRLQDFNTEDFDLEHCVDQLGKITERIHPYMNI